jgi:N-terminal half of MaoC dehydratase
MNESGRVATTPSDEPLRGEPFTMIVERGKIREFARAVKSRNAAYLDDEDALCPATFLMTAAFWQRRQHAAQGAPSELRRILHGEQEFVFFGPPPRAGDVLTGTQYVRRVWTRKGSRAGDMTFYEVVTEFKDGTGRLAVESRAVLIETGSPAEGPTE